MILSSSSLSSSISCACVLCRRILRHHHRHRHHPLPFCFPPQMVWWFIRANWMCPKCTYKMIVDYCKRNSTLTGLVGSMKFGALAQYSFLVQVTLCEPPNDLYTHIWYWWFYCCLVFIRVSHVTLKLAFCCCLSFNRVSLLVNIGCVYSKHTFCYRIARSKR